MVGGQRSRDPAGRRSATDAAVGQLPVRQCSGCGDGAGEGVSRGRDRADLREPGAPGRRDLRSRPDEDHRRVHEPRRSEPAWGAEGGRGGVQEGGTAQRRRDGCAPPEPLGRRRRRLPAAVPDRCSDERQDHRVLAVLRPARVSPGHGRHRAQREHARHVRRRRPRHQKAGSRRRRAGDRRGAYARVPDGHPGAAERPREDPVRAHRRIGQVQGDHDPRHLRLPRPARAAHRGGGHGRDRPSRSEAPLS